MCKKCEEALKIVLSACEECTFGPTEWNNCDADPEDCRFQALKQILCENKKEVPK